MNISILIYILTGVVVLLLVWIIVIERRLKKIFMGTKARDLEEVMARLSNQLADIKEKQSEINKHLGTIDKRLDKTIRNVEMIRFNPFEDAGSNQSFALALLNDEGNGIVISSLYARDRMSIFAKPITSGKSDFELSHEEKEVLEKAI